MADWRLRGIPPPLWRKVRDKAGDRLRDVLLGLLRAYADGEIDPLAPKYRLVDEQEPSAAERELGIVKKQIYRGSV